MFELAGKTLSKMVKSVYGDFTEQEFKDGKLKAAFDEAFNEFIAYGYISNLLRAVITEIKPRKLKPGWIETFSLLFQIVTPGNLYKLDYIKMPQ